MDKRKPDSHYALSSNIEGQTMKRYNLGRKKEELPQDGARLCLVYFHHFRWEHDNMMVQHVSITDCAGLCHMSSFPTTHWVDSNAREVAEYHFALVRYHIQDFQAWLTPG